MIVERGQARDAHELDCRRSDGRGERRGARGAGDDERRVAERREDVPDLGDGVPERAAPRLGGRRREAEERGPARRPARPEVAQDDRVRMLLLRVVRLVEDEQREVVDGDASRL